MTYTAEELRQAGIYAIINKVTGKRYIGSTNRFSKRWTGHRNRLNRNIHPNQHLQNSWNKHGEINFEFKILETLRDNLLEEWLIKREDWWIKLFGVTNDSLGYNICPAAGSTRGLKTKQETKEKISNTLAQLKNVEYLFRDPNGEIVKIVGMRKFCRDNNLPRRCMNMVYKGELKHCRGWTKYIENEEWQPPFIGRAYTTYNVISPEGKEIIITNLSKFCKDNDLSKDCMYEVIKGVNRTHKGYKNINYIAKQPYKFVSPYGELFEVTNLKDLCIKFKLDRHEMSKLHKEERDIYKGWRKYIEGLIQEKLDILPLRKTKSYVFFNPEGEQIEIPNLNAFCKANNLDTSQMCKVFYGKAKSYKKYTKYSV